MALSSTDADIRNGATVNITNSAKAGILVNRVGGETPQTSTLNIHGDDTTVNVSGRAAAFQTAGGKKFINIYDHATVTTNAYLGFMLNASGNVVVEDATVNMMGDESVWFTSTTEAGAPLFEIRNNAKVDGNRFRYYGKLEVDGKTYNYVYGNLVVIGGTLQLDNTYLEANYDTNGNGLAVWPTNSSVYGNERLTNFQLPNDAAHSNFSTFGWNKGAVAYKGTNVNELGSTYADQYVVDLTKEQGEGSLSVWVPAVQLTYHIAEGQQPGVSIENVASADFTTTLQDKDVIIRGQSIEFATLDGTPFFPDTYTVDGVTYDVQWYLYVGDSYVSFDADTTVTAQSEENIYGVLTTEVPEGPGPDDPEDPELPDPDPDPEIPLGEPTTETIPLGPVEEEIPLGAPSTGDEGFSNMFALMIAGAAIAMMGMLRRKSED